MGKSKSNIKQIELDEAIDVDGAKVAVLSMRKPKVKDMLAVEKLGKSDAEKEIFLLSNLCEVRPESIEELDLSDYAKLQRTYQDFLS